MLMKAADNCGPGGGGGLLSGPRAPSSGIPSPDGRGERHQRPEFDHCDWHDCDQAGVAMVEGRHYCAMHHVVAWTHELQLRRTGRFG